MKVSLYSLLFLLGVALSLILIVGVALRPRGKRGSKGLLIALLSSISIILLQEAGIADGGRFLIAPIYWVVMIMWFAVSPLLYLFIKSVVHTHFRFRTWHLALFAFPIFLLSETFLSMLGTPMGLHKLFKNQDFFTLCWMLSFLLMSLGFAMGSIRDINQANLPVEKGKQIRWMIWILYTFIIVLVVSVVLLIFFISTQEYSNQFEYSLLIIYELFILGLIVQMLRSSRYLEDIGHQTYANSSLDANGFSDLVQQLDRLMRTEKPYLDQDLSLTTLAKAIPLTETKLSQLFTQHLHTNFYGFVNQYRLEEFEAMVRDPKAHTLTIFAIAESCGFRSKASFYKVFKAKHQMTPSQYIERVI